MHRPSDQAKLLFFALLRGTVSALATDTRAAAAGVTLAAVKSPVLAPNIQLRLAQRADVPSLQRCNLATLPENYNSQFYVNHMRQWPDLCLVAEDNSMTDGGMEPDRPFGGPSFLGNHNNKQKSNVVAYVLGKVEERPPHQVYEYDDAIQPMSCDQDRFIGHVTSLAVLHPYRRKGLAAELMKQLHYHLEECYGAGAVGLHVRKSNEAACRLYQNYGYQIDLIIPGYYQDGEDAYFMKKPLLLSGPSSVTARASEVPKFPFLGRRPQRPWETGPVGLRLPRGLREEERPSYAPQDPADAEETPELLTGSM
ncbi:terminal acetyltransferase A complex catalytic subunit ARD1 [Seminavis robusta]|uniref:Terminal acetyltransferase A complex catalytic subunit ARD1 n=1 Tax=Seminavis robusta TaxID=568900 RepID=A0A9N8HNG1_9STRA|nr:terminal acetyltransferase A complex catalytic subunit ARD1 [Seminavis robusta]|eukprot:Sro817_g206780.1 terminal acetyltransferase A complex catalytic subunit ARD1 (310) ;mRNA; f:10209-11138